MNISPRAQALLSLLGIAAVPLSLAGIGVTHPHMLTNETASYWYTLHLALLPIFPLLAVNLWWLLADISGPLAWLARILIRLITYTKRGGLEGLLPLREIFYSTLYPDLVSEGRDGHVVRPSP